MKTDTIINQFDEQGLAHGTWEGYLSDGTLYYRINFRHGKKHGLWMEYLVVNGRQAFWKGEFKQENPIGLWYKYQYKI